MFCVACGTPLTPGLSYCNRCGTSLKERSTPSNPPRTGVIAAFLAAITVIGVSGLGIMLGGTVTLKNEANLPVELIGFFMLFTFITVIVIEILLLRQLSKVTSAPETKALDVAPQFTSPAQLHSPTPRSLAEPVPSVTENTTRTLQYSPNQPGS